MRDNINSQKKRGWLRRNLKWVLPISIVGGIAVFVSILFFTITGFMRSADAYQVGVAAAQKNAAVIELIGEPMQPASYFTGSVSVSNSNGNADIAISIKGPKGSGTIYVEAEKKFDVWNYSSIKFHPDGSNTLIDLQ
ncbi:cytochrome c oxidase assembly factor 1 family protein [Bartonella sp. HY329]|uniref:cytochrome c oxidase assembly factor 1 family protein n=1 Tax=unclassified Bartonella TaxID=2645622 RepID=UPI0021C9CAB8|nr:MULTISPECIES: cytochrome c oxidase assembly factor 1 family protein [unclassified Bartonella]UXM95635.1 cytochrome c oxidase assembly factor 1 family protein [Bartonella sp. HY329]UXN09960.1 cytochrome c oxidase assembly factor 1 family protein [Bartonella sp. HY328]